MGETIVGDPPVPDPPKGAAPGEAKRSRASDGLNNRIQEFVTTHGVAIWNLIQSIPALDRFVNAKLTNAAILKFPTRPNPLSTMADYTSWASLTDRTYSSRHLPPTETVDPNLPHIDDLEDLFTRTKFVPSTKSTVLFSYFAQWFTDGFLRSDRATPPNLAKNESNHEIDLTNLYGLNRDVAAQLRTGQGGLLKTQEIGGEEYPPFLCENGSIKPEFSLLTVVRFAEQSVEVRDQLFAMGSDTSNLQVGFIALNVLFLREHNRIARLLADAHSGWDDERLFATTRNILTVILMKIVLEDYINHITPTIFRISLEPRSFPNEPWYRENWMAVEFNLLYRWHSLVPDKYHIGEEEIPIDATLYNTEIVRRYGLGAIFEAASEQTAGEMGLGNTPYYLWYVEKLSLAMGRAVQLRSYNDYRELASMPRVTDFDQITGDVGVRDALRKHYGHVDNIEYYVGLFAEDVEPDGVCPRLLGRMVALDAFSQVYTNPLLATRIYNEETFSPEGMEIINSTKTLSQIVNRNVPAREQGDYFVSMTLKGWKRN